MNIAENVAGAGGTAFVVSLEMAAAQLAERTIARAEAINTQAMRSGSLSSGDMGALQAALHRVKDARLVIADDPALCSGTRIRMAARKVRQRLGALDLIVIDYLQLMQGHGNNRN